MLVGEHLPRHASDRWRRGYRQHTNAFRQYLLHSRPLSAVMFRAAVRHAWYFQNHLPRSKGPGPHSADQVKIERRTFGGTKGDRVEHRVVAYGQKNYKNATQTLRKSLVYVSGGKTITRGGKVK